MDPFSSDAVRAAYESAVQDYVAAFGDDLDRLPVDRSFLDRAISLAPSSGWVLEVGCGPAPAARHLGDRAPSMVGVDLSEGMLQAARERTPRLRVVQADLLELPLGAHTCTLVIASYCLQHIAREHLPRALAEVRRVLRPSGVLAVASHLGSGDIFADEMLGHPIDRIGGALYERDELLAILERSGFRVEHEQHRDPLPHEHDTQRIYVVARVA